MSSNAYHRLKDGGSTATIPAHGHGCFAWLLRRGRDDGDDDDDDVALRTQERLFSLTRHLDMRMRAKSTKIDASRAAAREFVRGGDLERARAELQCVAHLAAGNKRTLAMYVKLRNLYDDLDQAGTLANVAKTMGVATDTIQSAMEKLDLDAVVDSMNDLEGARGDIGDVARELGAGQDDEAGGVDDGIASELASMQAELDADRDVEIMMPAPPTAVKKRVKVAVH